LASASINAIVSTSGKERARREQKWESSWLGVARGKGHVTFSTPADRRQVSQGGWLASYRMPSVEGKKQSLKKGRKKRRRRLGAPSSGKVSSYLKNARAGSKE